MRLRLLHAACPSAAQTHKSEPVLTHCKTILCRCLLLMLLLLLLSCCC